MNERQQELISLLLDEGLEPDQEQELAAALDGSPELRTELRSLLTTQETLSQALNPERSSEKFIESFKLRSTFNNDGAAFMDGMQKRLQRSRSRRRPWRLAAAAAVIIIAALSIMVLEPILKPVGLIDPAQPGLTIQREGQTVSASRLGAGDVLRTAEGKQAMITLPDDRGRIRLNGNTSAQIHYGRLEVLQGQADLLINHHPGREPFRINALKTEVTVTGTRLSAAVVPDADFASARIAVQEGAVTVMQLDTKQKRDLTAGQYIVAAASMPFEIRSLPAAGWHPDLLGGAFADGGWIHFVPDEKFEQGFALVEGRLEKEKTAQEARAGHWIDFQEGEIEFNFTMQGPFWEFRLVDEADVYNHIVAGFDGRTKRMQTVRLKLTGTKAEITVDGKPAPQVPGLEPELELLRPISGRCLIRFSALGNTRLIIDSLRWRPAPDKKF